MADSRTVVGADVEAALDGLGAEVAEGTVGAGTGMTCFDFPGGIGTASRGSATTTSGVLLLCNFGDREYLDLLGPGSAGAGRGRARSGSCIAVCATDAPLSGAAAPAPGAAAAARPRPRGLLRVGRLRRDRRSRSRRPTDGAASATSELNAFFAAAYEAAHEAVYNCLVAARPARRLDGTMQEAFPIDAVSLAEAGVRRGEGGTLSSLRGEVVELDRGPDPRRHVESSGRRDAGRRAPRRLPAIGRGGLRARRTRPRAA